MMPIAVYGTLRPGCHNARLWEGRGTTVPGTIEGWRLVSLRPSGGFPYAIPAADQVTVVDLLTPTPEHYADVLYRLDGLEGYPHHYDRVEVTVSTADGTVRAWLYSPTGAEQYERMTPVPHNDWNRWRDTGFAGHGDYECARCGWDSTECDCDEQEPTDEELYECEDWTEDEWEAAIDRHDMRGIR